MSTFDLEERTRHGCADLTEDDDAWVCVICDCGVELGGFPDEVTAIDALIDHVVERSVKA